jgi:hypothetical protein
LATERRFRDATSAAEVIDLLEESIGVHAHGHARAPPSLPDAVVQAQMMSQEKSIPLQ